jgi:hypothetical protein
MESDLVEVAVEALQACARGEHATCTELLRELEGLPANELKRVRLQAESEVAMQTTSLALASY